MTNLLQGSPFDPMNFSYVSEDPSIHLPAFVVSARDLQVLNNNQESIVRKELKDMLSRSEYSFLFDYGEKNQYGLDSNRTVISYDKFSIVSWNSNQTGGNLTGLAKFKNALSTTAVFAVARSDLTNLQSLPSGQARTELEQNLEATIFHELIHSSSVINDVAEKIFQSRYNQSDVDFVKTKISRTTDQNGNFTESLEAYNDRIDSYFKEFIEHIIIYQLEKDYVDSAGFKRLDNGVLVDLTVREFGIQNRGLVQDGSDAFTNDVAESFQLSMTNDLTVIEQIAGRVIPYYDRSAGIGEAAISDPFYQLLANDSLGAVRAIAETQCFLAGTMIEMADGSQKPIEQIRPEDQVMAFDKDGKKVAGRVTRTMTNESKIILDFHGTFVTPGHVYYCAGGKFEGGFAPLIDILRDDGVVRHEDNTLIRAATGCKVGSELDAEIWVLGIEADANGVYHEKIRKKLRLGTRFIIPDGSSISIAEDLRKIGMRARADGFVEHIVTGQKALYQWPVGGQMPPNPEDYVLQRSGTTLEDIYRAGEWEGQRPQMPPPMIRDGGEVTPVSERTLMAMPRNVPMAMREGTPADTAPKLNRKARKAQEAKRRKAAKHSRGNATLH